MLNRILKLLAHSPYPPPLARFKLAIMLGLSFVVAACQRGPTVIALTPPPTPTVPTLTATASPSPAPTPTRTRLPTATFTPTATPTPTLQPPRWAEWQNLGIASTSIRGPGNYLYTLYFAEDSMPPGHCNLLVTRWDGDTPKAIWTYQDDLACMPFNWEGLRQYAATQTDMEVLGAAGYWSDINANGLPEFSVDFYDGCSSCDARSGWEAIYEIQDPNTLQDIVPMEVKVPWGDLLHTDKPRTVVFYKLLPYDIHDYVGADWIYRWDGQQFVNVSPEYAEEYRAAIAEVAQGLQKDYGQPLDFQQMEDFLTILVLTNVGQLPAAEGLQTFLEVSDPKHWPSTTPNASLLCWLQLVRAQAQLDEEAGRPFAVYDYRNVYIPDDAALNGLNAVAAPYAQRFDVSACQTPSE